MRPTTAALCLFLSACATTSGDRQSTSGGSSDPCAYSNADGRYATELIVPGSRDGLVRLLNIEDDEGYLLSAAQAFYEEQPDVYDFLFLFVNDSKRTRAAARHMPIASRSNHSLHLYTRGTPEVSEIAPNLRSIILVSQAGNGNFGGPLLHELLHEHGPMLKPIYSYAGGNHWGVTGVDGNLGGFEPETLQCVSPEGATPPDCDVVEGRYEVFMEPFGRVANMMGMGEYAPLELYLLGLVGPDEVPPIPVFEGAREISGRHFSVTGVRELTIEEIIEETGGGVRTLLPPEERTVRAAFAYVGEVSANEEQMETIIRQAKGMGGVERLTFNSYCTATGGRGQMVTHLE